MSLYAAMKSGIEEINRDNRRDFLSRMKRSCCLIWSGFLVMPR
jgi:hypothetical protein